MPTSSTLSPKQRAKQKTKPRAKAPSKSSEPFLRFYHSKQLRAKTLVVLASVEKAKEPTQYRDGLADIIVELTDSGMDYYYLRPLKIAKAGFFVEQSANLGMSAATKVLGSVIRNIVGRMDKPQLISVCGYIRQLMA